MERRALAKHTKPFSRVEKGPFFRMYFLSPQAQLVGMRTDIQDVAAGKDVAEKELHTLLLQLHASQLELHELRGLEVNSQEIKHKLVGAERKVLEMARKVANFPISSSSFFSMFLENESRLL